MEMSKNILYLFGYSLNNYKPLKKLINIIKEQKELGANIAFVFMHYAVIGLTKKSKMGKNFLELIDLPISFYILQPDLKARGIDPSLILEKITKIEYENLVDLLVVNTRIISWV